jgi:outer membrane lipopolysaccharide assembly protein LptE/RlpB
MKTAPCRREPRSQCSFNLGVLRRFAPVRSFWRSCGVAGAFLLVALLSASCGYHAAGSASSLPPDIQVLAIPSFQNLTHTYHLETGLTGAVIREFNTQTRYRTVQSEEGADAVLRGALVSVQVAPVTYDSMTGRASSGLVTMVLKVSLTARDGHVLYSNSHYVFRDQYQIASETESFFEEQNPALQRMQQDVSRALVSNILEAF